MPRLRRKEPERTEPASFAPHTDVVYAVTDVTKGLRRVKMGEPLRRDDELVRELPDAFAVRLPLTLLEEA